jgi:2-iminobutanoate/2-iminopropanoate deaminase
MWCIAFHRHTGTTACPAIATDGYGGRCYNGAESLAKTEGAEQMTDRKVINSVLAPQAIGPYSQAVRTGDLIFVSGQIPLDPQTGELVAGDIGAQTERVLQNVQAILESAGSAMANIVKTTVFLADIGDFAAMNEAYGRFFPNDPPARSAFQVAALPKGARVEIEVVAQAG